MFFFFGSLYTLPNISFLLNTIEYSESQAQDEVGCLTDRERKGKMEKYIESEMGCTSMVIEVCSNICIGLYRTHALVV
jgi:hypothetical protein